MDDTFIHSTEEEHMDDLMDLFKVLWKYGLKISPLTVIWINCKIYGTSLLCLYNTLWHLNT